MIPGDREIIPQAVHDLYDLRALGNGADRSPLNCIARVYKKHIVILRFELLLIEGKSVIADIVLKSYVHIIGVEDHGGHFVGIAGRIRGFLGRFPA